MILVFFIVFVLRLYLTRLKIFQCSIYCTYITCDKKWCICLYRWKWLFWCWQSFLNWLSKMPFTSTKGPVSYYYHIGTPVHFDHCWPTCWPGIKCRPHFLGRESLPSTSDLVYGLLEKMTKYAFGNAWKNILVDYCMIELLLDCKNRCCINLITV